MQCTLPRTPGHEGAGVVEAVAAGVTCLAVGERVGVAFLASACGACSHCLTGWETLCPSQQRTGYSSDGCFAEYVALPAAFCVRLPAALSLLQAPPLLCAGVTVWKAIKESEVRPGQWLLVLGATGGLGSLAVQFGAAMGLQVLAADVAPESSTYALRLGASAYVPTKNSSVAQTVAALKRETGALGGVAAALIIAPSLDSYQVGVGALCPGGTAIAISLPSGGAAKVDILPLVLERKTLRGSIVGTRVDLSECLNFAVLHNIFVETRELPLESVNEAMGDLKAGRVRGRVVLRIAFP
jgi:propanol-preferring alcohol dehydrogenase